MVSMSPKELLYIEDALGHQKYLYDKFSKAAQSLTDSQLQQMVMQMTSRQQQLFDQFYNLV